MRHISHHKKSSVTQTTYHGCQWTTSEPVYRSQENLGWLLRVNANIYSRLTGRGILLGVDRDAAK